MKRTPILLATTLTLLVVLPAAAQVKKMPATRAVPVVAPLVLPPAASEQLAAAAFILFGDYACEFDKSLRVSLNPKFDGYVDLLFDKQLFTLKPVLSHTGALRLEDVRGRLLLVQIPVKSMVMDVKIGRRLVDDCTHETQFENRRKLAAAPALPGLGIGPGGGAYAIRERSRRGCGASRKRCGGSAAPCAGRIDRRHTLRHRAATRMDCRRLRTPDRMGAPGFVRGGPARVRPGSWRMPPRRSLTLLHETAHLPVMHLDWGPRPWDLV